MIRVLLFLVLAVALVGAGATSASHALAHDAPRAAHDAHDGTDHAAALAECCDAVGTKGGGSCFADVLQTAIPAVGSETSARVTTLPGRVAVGRGVSTAVPTGPPKV